MAAIRRLVASFRSGVPRTLRVRVAAFLTCLGFLASLASVALGAGSERRILVYTKNGKGYVHDNIQHSVDAIKKMGAENGFGVDVSDDPKVFTDGNLKQYKALVFSNSNNEAFENDAQRGAFKRYIQSGGGFVGIHSASGSERKWDYYWSVLGGTFVRHPKFQTFTVKVKDPNHPSTRGMPATFEWADECYYHDKINPDIHVLLLPPFSDLEINAIVHASTIVFQKSVKEGFGLTVSEALWKRKPVIGSAVGGIKIQIVNGVTGFLIHSPEGAANRALQLLSNLELRRYMGENGYQHVKQNFLLTRNVKDYLLIMLALDYPGTDVVSMS